MCYTSVNLAVGSDPRLVALSVIVSVVGSYTALDMAEQTVLSQRQVRHWWLIGSGLSLGITVWAMHFTAILSQKFSVSVSYDFAIVLLSLVIAAVGSGIGFWVLSRSPEQSRQAWLGGGFLIGSTIVVMHYTAMSSMRLAAIQIYEPTQVVLSWMVAIAATITALKLMNPPGTELSLAYGLHTLASALLMGTAISGMHFTAMSGVCFRSALAVQSSFSGIAGSLLTMVIGTAALLVLALALVASFFGRRLSAELATIATLRQNEEHLANLVQQRTQELEREKLASEAADQMKSTFLANMSHELRTPLTSIIGFSSVLLQQIFGSLNDRQVEYLQRISNAGHHLLELINDLLDLSRIEAGREELAPEVLEVEEVCQICFSIVREQAAQKGLELSLVIDPEVSTCVADKRRLVQILLNLLANAIKFTSEGSVTLSVDRAESFVQFAVIDTGVGISESEQASLFQPFQQLDSGLDRKYEGTGLGLALSQKLAQLQKGYITVQSQPAQGSRFTLSLPEKLSVASECERVNSPSLSRGVEE